MKLTAAQVKALKVLVSLDRSIGTSNEFGIKASTLWALTHRGLVKRTDAAFHSAIDRPRFRISERGILAVAAVLDGL